MQSDKNLILQAAPTPALVFPQAGTMSDILNLGAYGTTRALIITGKHKRIL